MTKIKNWIRKILRIRYLDLGKIKELNKKGVGVY
jgi:hypothetical protein